ncbi:MAG: hypothetical protein DBW90_03055 [Halieaceae bacterium]|jgi:hypothetical protein|nr:MAG: hypothetical protein DBW90_03055 [Halieaceae bacterium]|tara:strand:+ start:1451 stop:1822 length:372 start_codon:yes stop_codon:yes gene_type:complete
MLIALLTVMLLGGGSYELSTFIAEGQENINSAVEDLERRQTALDILAAMEQSMLSDSGETTALIERARQSFSEEKVWSAEELDALFAEARSLNADRAQRFIELRLELKSSLTSEEWDEAFPSS